MLHIINSILWSIAIVLLLGGGLYFSIKLGFPQFKIKGLFKGLKNNGDSEVSPYKSLTISLAGRIGVGSLAGISLAIYIGGPGSIFWIWVAGIITSINAFCESYLGAKYQEKDGTVYKGGPSYYIAKGLGNKKLATTYAILLIIAYIVGFMTIQANTITKSIVDYFNTNTLLVGIILALISGYSIMKGISRIVRITSKIIPLMGLTYIFISILVIILNLESIPRILLLIVTEAFNIKALGMGVLSSFVIGIQRGIFSTEAGLGSGSIASSSATAKDKISLSMIQVLGIYFTVFVICTSTALIVLTSDYTSLNLTNINGIELTNYALNYHLGDFGSIALIFTIITFAYTTIVAGYYYGEIKLKYLIKEIKPIYLNLFKIITVIIVLFGSIIRPDLLWRIIDLLVALLAIINMYTLIKLRKEIINDYRNK